MKTTFSWKNYTRHIPKKATLTLLMSVTFLYFACANEQSMGTNIKKPAHYIHGHSPSGKKSKEYIAWLNIRKRCYKIDYDKYEFYGGRGIVVCEKWINSFQSFLLDVGMAPSPKHSIDRIDVNGNYEPGNVRWITHTDQCNNRRSNVFIEYEGIKMTVKQWSKRNGINYGTLYSRIFKRGWSIERAFNE